VTVGVGVSVTVAVAVYCVFRVPTIAALDAA
jgi:hypothetical protein